jgi:transposase
MKSNYIQYILDMYMEGWGIAYPTMQGICIDTPHTQRIMAHLSIQRHNQFILVHSLGIHGIQVSINPKVKTVCKECGSPYFWTHTTEKQATYIDSTHLKARINKLLTRKSQTNCQFCGTEVKVKVHGYPEIN